MASSKCYRAEKAERLRFTCKRIPVFNGISQGPGALACYWTVFDVVAHHVTSGAVHVVWKPALDKGRILCLVNGIVQRPCPKTATSIDKPGSISSSSH